LHSYWKGDLALTGILSVGSPFTLLIFPITRGLSQKGVSLEGVSWTPVLSQVLVEKPALA